MGAERDESFAEQLRRYRERAGLTQEELAARAGLSAQGISALERGLRRRPYLPTVRALAEALGLSPQERATFATAVTRDGGKREEQPGAVPPPAARRPPAPLTALLGRDNDLAELRNLLDRDEVRLVTLTGPGGVGKSRLALQIAASLTSSFADGVVFVPLAAIRDPALVPPAIAATLGIPEVRGREVGDALVVQLQNRELLLVLDNFEQVLPAAPGLTALLARCPRLKVLVTSRARLLVSGEWDLPIGPLGLPDVAPTLNDLRRYPATILFLQRALAANPRLRLTDTDAPVIAEICRRLDGLPLAIELAAARVTILPPVTLLARLEPRLPLLSGGPRDQPARLRTMHDAVAWSYELLTPDQQVLFRRLAVFTGGFTLEAAEAVGDTVSTPVLELVGALVDQSLLQVEEGVAGEPRYQMLETIREFALERLEEQGEAEEARARHAAWYLAFAARVDAELEGPEMFRWLRRVEAEHPNLRAAIRRLTERGENGAALRLGAGLSAFWWYRGHYAEGRAQLEGLLAQPGASAHPLAWARAMTGLGTLSYKSGAVARALQLHEQAMPVWRALGDPERLAYACWSQGLAAGGTDDDLAVAALTEAYEIGRRLGKLWLALPPRWALGRIARMRGDHETARRLVREALAHAYEQGHPIGVPLSLVVLGHIELDRGEIDQAASLLGEALRYLHDLGDRWGRTGGLRGVAGVAAAPWGVPACLEALAAVASARGDAPRAARLFGATASLRELVGYAREPVDEPGFAVWVAATRRAIDEAAFARAWEEGRGVPCDVAVAEALAIAGGHEPSRFPQAAIMEMAGRTEPGDGALRRVVIAGGTRRGAAP